MKVFDIHISSLGTTVQFEAGQNEKENFDLIDKSGPDDIWFHIEGRPSAHVVAHIPEGFTKKTISQIVKQGALLSKIISKFSSEKNVEIVYAKIKDVEKTEIMGSVILQHSKKIII